MTAAANLGRVDVAAAGRRPAARRRVHAPGTPPVWARAGRLVIVALLLVWSLGPVAIGILTSLSTQAEVSAVPAQLLPRTPNLDAYRSLLGHGGAPTGPVAAGTVGADETQAFTRALLNGAVSTVLAVLVILAVSIAAGYAFSRLRFRGRLVTLVVIIATLAIPAVALVVPLFQLLASAHLIDTQLGLVLIYTSATVPLGVWLFYNYCEDVTTDPEEAALMDGCNRWQALRHVVVPQLVPGIAALTAILMLAIWGQFFIPLLFAPTLHTKPVPVLITEFSGKYRTDYPLVAAVGVLALLPPAVVATVLNRHIRAMLSGLSV